jgi:hypothetical protein
MACPTLDLGPYEASSLRCAGHGARASEDGREWSKVSRGVKTRARCEGVSSPARGVRCEV